MNSKSKRPQSKLNALVTVLVMLAAIWFFSSRSNDGAAPSTAVPTKSPGKTSSPVTPEKSAQPAAKTSEQPAHISNIPAAIPADRVVVTQESGTTELPADIQEQLNAQPPELPEDLKRQLNSPPPELPDDLKAQLKAPPPELPDDIKRAMQIPPRLVTIDEVNNPQHLKDSAPQAEPPK